MFEIVNQNINLINNVTEFSSRRKHSLLVYLSLFSMHNITYTNIQNINKMHQSIQYRITRDCHRQISSQT